MEAADDALERFGAVAALSAGLVPAAGGATTLIFSMATWTNADERPLSDPSGIWAIVCGLFVAFGAGLSALADTVRTPPHRPWERVPGLDRAYIEHYATIGKVDPTGWIIAGRLIWILAALAVGIAVAVLGASSGAWQ